MEFHSSFRVDRGEHLPFLVKGARYTLVPAGQEGGGQTWRTLPGTTSPEDSSHLHRGQKKGAALGMAVYPYNCQAHAPLNTRCYVSQRKLVSTHPRPVLLLGTPP
uniref:Uncharacterized protein n=1 Tax=Pan troglodytes TaxID=9598 RepID=A0A2I3SVX8_PANTR